VSSRYFAKKNNCVANMPRFTVTNVLACEETRNQPGITRVLLEPPTTILQALSPVYKL
jgi:hypothetical protein